MTDEELSGTDWLSEGVQSVSQAWLTRSMSLLKHVRNGAAGIRAGTREADLDSISARCILSASMATTTNLWIPVCCERVMRFNIFMMKGEAYGSLVCTTCNKSVSFELEHQTDLTTYGQGALPLNMLGTPKPPKEVRHTVDENAAMDDSTL